MVTVKGAHLLLMKFTRDLAAWLVPLLGQGVAWGGFLQRGTEVIPPPAMTLLVATKIDRVRVCSWTSHVLPGKTVGCIFIES